MNEQTGDVGEVRESESPRKVFFRPDNQLLRGILIGSGVMLAVLVVFWLGMLVGERKADFSHRIGDRFSQEFGERVGPGPFGRHRVLPPPGRGFFGGHGAVGEVVKVESGRLVMVGRDNVERTIILGRNTVIIKGRERIAAGEIKEGNRVVVVGSPNDEGQIDARLVRVFDLLDTKGMMWELPEGLEL